MTRQRRTRSLCALGLAASLSAVPFGCGPKHLVLNEAGLDRGLVIVLPGIDGRAPHNEGVCRTLCKGSPGLAAELYDWTAPLGPIFNQCATERNRREAARLAEHIRDYRRAHPGGSVHLIGHSGGTAIAVWAAEALPRDQRVGGLVLLASSLSPGYDLSPALRRSRKGIVSICSHRDTIMLGAGTSFLGTMDGPRCESAGKVGFAAPAGAGRDAAYAHLHEIRWQPHMAALGYDGGHFSCTSPRFVAACIAPLLEAGSWSPQVVAAAAEAAREPGAGVSVSGRAVALAGGNP